MLFARGTRSLFRLASVRAMATEAAATTGGKREGLSLTFGSGAQTFYKDAKVKQVDVPSYSGTLGILANHVPILAELKPGVVIVHEEDGSAKKIFVAAGSVNMSADSTLTVLATLAVEVEDLDLDAAQKNLAAANSQSTPEGKIQVEVNQAILDSVKA